MKIFPSTTFSFLTTFFGSPFILFKMCYNKLFKRESLKPTTEEPLNTTSHAENTIKLKKTFTNRTLTDIFTLGSEKGYLIGIKESLGFELSMQITEPTFKQAYIIKLRELDHLLSVITAKESLFKQYSFEPSSNTLVVEVTDLYTSIIFELTKKRTELQTQVNIYNSENSVLNSTNNQAEIITKERQDLLNEITELTNKCEIFAIEKANMEDKLVLGQQEVKNLKQKNDNLIEEKETLKKAKEEADNYIETTIMNNSQTEREATRELENQLLITIEEMKALKITNENKHTKEQQISANLQKLQELNKTLNKEITESNSSYQEKIQRKELIITNLSYDLEQTNFALKELKKKSDILETTYTTLKQNHNALIEELSAQKESYNNLVSVVTHDTNSIHKLHNTILKKNKSYLQEITTIHNTINNRVQTIKDAQEQYRKKNLEIAEHRSSQRLLFEELIKKQHQISDLTALQKTTLSEESLNVKHITTSQEQQLQELRKSANKTKSIIETLVKKEEQAIKECENLFEKNWEDAKKIEDDLTICYKKIAELTKRLTEFSQDIPGNFTSDTFKANADKAMSYDKLLKDYTKAQMLHQQRELNSSDQIKELQKQNKALIREASLDSLIKPTASTSGKILLNVPKPFTQLNVNKQPSSFGGFAVREKTTDNSDLL